MKTNNTSRLILTVGLFISLSALYLFKLKSSFNVNSDFGRDIFEMQKIVSGDPTLIGPMLSVGIFGSPLYFYFYAPILALFHQNPVSIIYANAVLFSAVFSTLFYFLSKKKDIFSSLLFILVPALLLQTIYSGRYPGNAFSYSPFLLSLIIFPLLEIKISKKSLFILGILSFISLSFHPITLFGIVPLVVWLVISQRKKLLQLLYYFIPTIMFILPMVVFELRHNFLITQNFTYRVASNLLPINNFNFIKQTLVNNYSSYIFIFSFLAIILFIRYFKKYSLYEKILTLWTIITFLLLIFIIPKYDWSYLISLNLMLGIVACISFTKTRLTSLLIAPLLLLIVMNFPHNHYQISKRPLSRFQNATDLIATNYPSLKNEKFNIMQVSDPSILVPVGHEYRFFLRKRGFTSLPETNYSDAKTLLIFSEIGETNIRAIDNWEINQFGKKFNISLHQKIDEVDIYVLSK
ncbi:TPA: hypothetical protein DEP81_01775 [Candidatus Woesebacteria bacterium]|nr:hypothetical protein [Candidatus Woesebacteria bacterium]